MLLGGISILGGMVYCRVVRRLLIPLTKLEQQFYNWDVKAGFAVLHEHRQSGHLGLTLDPHRSRFGNAFSSPLLYSAVCTFQENELPVPLPVRYSFLLSFLTNKFPNQQSSTLNPQSKIPNPPVPYP